MPFVIAGSTKAVLDRDWSDPEQRCDALGQLVAQIASLQSWLDGTDLAQHGLINPYVEAVEQILAQDTEQDAQGRVRIIRGVAADRRVSIEHPEVRHGRKSKSKRFSGYKQHIATDLEPR